MPKPPKTPVPRRPASRPGTPVQPPANSRAPAQRRAALASHYRARFRTGDGR